MVHKHSQLACTIKEGSWVDFREDVEKIDPILFHIIEQISPNKRYKLIEATYLYGEKNTDLGTICLPDKEGNLVRLDDLRLLISIESNLVIAQPP